MCTSLWTLFVHYTIIQMYSMHLCIYVYMYSVHQVGFMELSFIPYFATLFQGGVDSIKKQVKAIDGEP